MNIFASIPHVWQWQLNQTSQMHSSTHAWSDLHGSGNQQVQKNRNAPILDESKGRQERTDEKGGRIGRHMFLSWLIATGIYYELAIADQFICIFPSCFCTTHDKSY